MNALFPDKNQSKIDNKKNELNAAFLNKNQSKIDNKRIYTNKISQKSPKFSWFLCFISITLISFSEIQGRDLGKQRYQEG